MIIDSSGSRDGSQRLVHRVSQPDVHALDNVAIGVEGDVYASVAQQLLDIFWMLACHEEYCSAGVAEVVEPDGW